MKNIFKQTVDVIEHEYYDSAFLSGDWKFIKTAHEEQFSQAESTKDKEQILKSLLESLRVSHSMLIDPQLAQKIAQQEAAPEDSIVTQMYADILIVQVRSFQVRSIDKAQISRVAKLAKETSAIVFDLRLNGGGSACAVVELASLLLPPESPILQVREKLWQQQEKPFVMTTLPRDKNLDHALEVGLMHKHHWVEYRTVKSSQAINSDKPLIVITDQHCYSCGEVFVQCMKEFTSATLVGRKTSGSVVAAEQHDLTDGYSILVPFAEMISGKGQNLEGVGVSPDIEMDLSESTHEQIIAQLYKLSLLPQSSGQA